MNQLIVNVCGPNTHTCAYTPFVIDIMIIYKPTVVTYWSQKIFQENLCR